jgi:site-specific DNA-methyltransferase (adenine-specific)
MLICGDSLIELKKIKSNSIDFIFSDPPYFLSNNGISCSNGKMVSVNKGTWDKSRGFKENGTFQKAWIKECKRILTKNGTIAISGTYHSIYQCGYILQELGFSIINDIAWFKPNGAPCLACRNFTASHETII